MINVRNINGKPTQGEECTGVIENVSLVLEENTIQLIADDYYVAGLNLETGKLDIYGGVDIECLSLDDAGCIEVERHECDYR